MEKHKLFVGNLNFDATESDIKDLFSHHGTVVSVRVQRKKGCAFVEMSDETAAAAVISKLNKSEFKGRELRISLELPPKRAKSLTRTRYREQSKKISKKRAEDVSKTASLEGPKKKSKRP